MSLPSTPDPRPSILVIDDTPANLRFLAAILHNEGYGVRIARNGRQGLDSARELPPDLILLDIMMEEMDGYEVCRELKGYPSTAGVPVIFVSALNEVVHRVKGFEVGGVDFITKPFQTAEILARVGLHLSLAGLRRTLEQRNRELHYREAMLRAMSDAAHDAMVMIDASDRVLFWNQAAERLFGYSSEEMLGQPFHTRILPAREQPAAHAGLERFRETGSGPLIGPLREMTAYTREGEPFPIELSVSAFNMDGEWYAVGSIRNISERKRAEQELHEAANIDSLTGLSNRRHFLERCETELARCRRHGRPVSLMMLDLDHFKQINDRYGHPTGDLVLARLGELIQANLRRIDIGGRLGGEEFAIMMPDTNLQGASKAAQRLLELVRALPLRSTDDRPFGITCSIGLRGLQNAPERLLTLFEDADKELYRAKHNGRDRLMSNGPEGD